MLFFLYRRRVRTLQTLCCEVLRRLVSCREAPPFSAARTRDRGSLEWHCFGTVSPRRERENLQVSLLQRFKRNLRQQRVVGLQLQVSLPKAMRGDHDYPYEPLAATDTPFAASLGDRAPSFNGIYGSAGSSPQGDSRSHWGEDSVDRSPHAESPLPPSASGLSAQIDKPPERGLLKANLKKTVNRSHLHQRESRARYPCDC